MICILSHQVLVLCCSTATLSSSPQDPDGIQAAETPETWPWSCPRVTIHLIQRFIFGNCSVNSGKISSCAPTNIPENSHWCFSFLPFPWDKALRAILLSLLVLFWYIMWQSVSKVSLLFPLSSCLYPPSLCHPQLLVSLSVFLLVPSWSICHFSSVVHAPSSPTSSLPLVSLLFLSFIFSPLVSELLSLIPPLHFPPFIVLLSVILAKSTFIGEEYPHGNTADGDFWLTWLFFFPPTAKSQSVFEIKSGCDSISCSGEGTREKQD